MDINRNTNNNNYKSYKPDMEQKIIKNNYNPVQGIHCPTLLNKAFFHNKNIALIQKLIKESVYKNTDNKYKIDDQSEDEIIKLMRDIYLEHGKNLDTCIKGQIKVLNSIVVEKATTLIITQIKQHIAYLKKINSNLMPIDRAVSTTNTGTKLQEVKRFI
jgi:hypothetical protein